MKKFFLLLLVLFCCSSTLSADQYVECVDQYLVSSFNCYAPDWDGEYVIRTIDFQYSFVRDPYFGERDEYSFFYYRGGRRYCFFFTSDDVEKLRSNLQKVQEWSKLAKENKLSITKDLPLPDSIISVRVQMCIGNKCYTSILKIPLTFRFFSEIDSDRETIILSIIGGTSVAFEDEFVDIEFEGIAFMNEQIDFFINAISSKAVESAREKYEKKKKDADMFN